MATVPGTPDNVVNLLHPSLRSTPMDALMAAAVMHQQGKFQVAANVLPIRGQKSLQRAIEEAEGDEDLKSIAGRLQKRGYAVPPQLGPGVLSPAGDK